MAQHLPRVALLAGTLAATLSLASPATATPTEIQEGPKITSLSCESGASQFRCSVEITPGAWPFHHGWIRNGHAQLAYKDKFWFMGTCLVGRRNTVEVVVIEDFTAAVDAQACDVPCNPGPWQ